MDRKLKFAVSCTSGGYKNVFSQGVLKALEERAVRADAYAACSSSVLIAAFASFGEIDQVGLSLWEEGSLISRSNGNTQSQAMLYSIRQTWPEISRRLWNPGSSRLLVAVSHVKTEEAASRTQTDQARRLGQKLVIDSLRRQSEWKDRHLELRMFDTQPREGTWPLTEHNFEEVAYATTRVLHAWDIPASIDGEPYVDGCYTCVSPVLPLAAQGYENILCITNEHDKTYLDLFSAEPIPGRVEDSVVHFIKPDRDLKEIGADYFSFTPEGIREAFRQGYEKGLAFDLSCLD